MNAYIIYGIIFVFLLILEQLYFKIADHFNIVDKPNERSSHTAIVLRGGGIIFLVGVWLWCAFFGPRYGLFLAAVTIAAGISFIDDVHSLPDSVRLVAQFIAMGLLIWQVFAVKDNFSALEGNSGIENALIIVAALVVCVGATNIYNFMDGINGITAGYSLAVLLPLIIINITNPFIEESYLVVMCLSVLVFSFFNFRNKGKAKCFAGDVGSVGMAFVLLFAIGMLIVSTKDVTWLVLLMVYGVDGCMTICHRIMLHEHLGEAHRKHAFQLMANELRISHPVVSLVYMGLQLVVSAGFIFLCPILVSAAGCSLVICHWGYFGIVLLTLVVTYIFFMRKYYHLHEEYLKSIGSK